MTIPIVDPIVVLSPSLGHRKICVAGVARGHPDSGEAAIMGVPLPHLVLPLSGCLSRHTPTRATRGEARGHRIALAQNSLLMYPLLFPSFGLVVGLVCPRHMVDWSQCVCAALDAFLPGFARWCYFVDMWVAEGHTAQWPWLMCVESASPRNVGVDRHRACPHHRDVGPLVHSRCQWWCDPLGNNGSCEVVCANRGRSTHIGYPRWSGRVGGMRVRSVAFIVVCVSIR